MRPSVTLRLLLAWTTSTIADGPPESKAGQNPKTAPGLANQSSAMFMDGDEVVVIEPNLELKARDEIVDHAPFGHQYIVLATSRDQIEIENKRPGWADATRFVRASESKTYFEKQLEKSPGNADLKTALALACYRKNEPDRAMALLNEAIQIEDSSTRRSYRSLAWRNQGDFANALADLQAAVKLDPNDAGNHQSLACLRLDQGQFEAALLDLDNADRQSPKNSRSLVIRAIARMFQGDFQKAIAHCSEAIELDPTNHEAYSTRGTIRLANNELNQALEDSSKAMELRPRDARYHCMHGVASLRREDFDQALLDLNHAIRLDPQNANYHNLRGVIQETFVHNLLAFYTSIHRNETNINDPIEAYTRAIELADISEPGSLESFGFGFSTSFGEQVGLKGIGPFDRKLDSAKRKAKFLSNRGVAWMSKGETDKAIADFNESLKLHSTAKVYFHRASLLAEVEKRRK